MPKTAVCRHNSPGKNCAETVIVGTSVCRLGDARNKQCADLGMCYSSYSRTPHSLFSLQRLSPGGSHPGHEPRVLTDCRSHVIAGKIH